MSDKGFWNTPVRDLVAAPLRSAGRAMANFMVKAYDANWFLRFLRLADEEDWESASGGVGDAYEQQAWVNIAVSKIAGNIARAPFEVYAGDEQVPKTNPVARLFSRVNPYMSRYQLWEATTSWLLTKGESFWVFDVEYQSGNIPTEIWVFDPTKFEHHVDDTGRRITLYEYIDREKRIRIPFVGDELIHFMLWNKKSMFRGRNPLFALDTEVQQEDLAEKWNTALLKNRSTPPGVLSSDKPISEAQAKEIVERWEKQHRGASRQHKIAVLGHGTKYQNISLTPAEIEYMTLRKWNRQTVLSKYGVLPAVAGIKDENTPLSGKDTDEQLKMFWTLTLLPILRFYEDKLRTDFFQRLFLEQRTGMTGRFNLDSIPELQEDQDKRSERHREEIRVGLETINEVRKQRGLDPVPWGDAWWAPFNLVPAGSTNGKRPPEDEPAKMRDVTPLKLLLSDKRFAPQYPEQFKASHWQKVVKGWESLESDFTKAIRGWVYENRTDVLATFAEVWQEGSYYEAIEQIADQAYWGERAEAFAVIAEPHMLRALEMTGEQLAELFVELGVRVEPNFSIYDTNALKFLRERVTKVKGLVSETMRNQVRGALEGSVQEGLTTEETAGKIRDVFNIGSNRAKMIARTELGGVINDSRIEGFLSEGFLYHEWLSSRDAKVRPGHQIDGEVVEIGKPFSNGLLYPNEPTAPADQTIGCRCISLPLQERPRE